MLYAILHIPTAKYVTSLDLDYNGPFGYCFNSMYIFYGKQDALDALEKHPAYSSYDSGIYLWLIAYGLNEHCLDINQFEVVEVPYV